MFIPGVEKRNSNAKISGFEMRNTTVHFFLLCHLGDVVG